MRRETTEEWSDAAIDRLVPETPLDRVILDCVLDDLLTLIVRDGLISPEHVVGRSGPGPDGRWDLVLALDDGRRVPVRLSVHLEERYGHEDGSAYRLVDIVERPVALVSLGTLLANPKHRARALAAAAPAAGGDPGEDRSTPADAPAEEDD